MAQNALRQVKNSLLSTTKKQKIKIVLSSLIFTFAGCLSAVERENRMKAIKVDEMKGKFQAIHFKFSDSLFFKEVARKYLDSKDNIQEFKFFLITELQNPSKKDYLYNKEMQAESTEVAQPRVSNPSWG